PREVTAGSTMNALAHCVEALYAQERNPIVSIMALEGAKALKRGSVIVAGDPGDVEGRSDLLYGAFLAGASLGAVGMAIHHRICHVLGGTFGLAHGDANAVILPHVVAYNREAEPEVMAALADALGVVDPALGLRELAETIGAPTSLSNLGIREPDLDKATEMIVEGGGYNPRPVEREWIRQLLEDAFAGRPPSAQ
ncbi:MAG TPA: iron-containing alcohol dehydrogenase, partial [Acidimicrobiia bacterium]|nr:iron-containing alcohol dehydrogenase [Acidimicrobiia bacterium]